MGKRATDLARLGRARDGISQRGRALPALDPNSVAVDERTTEELLRFVRALAGRLRYFEADMSAPEPHASDTWAAFAHRSDLSEADIAAFMADPARFVGEPARWLSRPHFALLLAFLALLRHAQADLRGLTRRHLDYYFRDVLRMAPLRAKPDAAIVVFRLADRAEAVRLEAGTALLAGRDRDGVPQTYLTERALTIGRAQIGQLRSVYVDRQRVMSLADVREDRSLTSEGVVDEMLRLALGVPRPGDAIPPWIEDTEEGADEAVPRPVNAALFLEVVGPELAFASRRLERLEAHLSMSASQLERVVRFLEALHEGERPDAAAWRELDGVLEAAHRERVFAARRRYLAQEVAQGDEGVRGFENIARYVVQRDAVSIFDWTAARSELERHLAPSQLAVLDTYRASLVNETAPRRVAWSDVLRVFERAQRSIKRLPDPVARRAAWRNLFAYENAREVLDAPETSARWKAFGRVAPADEASPPAHTIGWALSSPVLELSSGHRSIHLQLTFTRGLETFKEELSSFESLEVGLSAVLRVAYSTEQGWVERPLRPDRIRVSEPPFELPGPLQKMPGVQLSIALAVVIQPDDPPLTAPPGVAHPQLRLLLRQRWNADARAWTMAYPPFARLQLAGVGAFVNVGELPYLEHGLQDLALQHEESALDASKPFAPFGAQPVAGARLYIGHPELLRKRLERVALEIDWTGLPANPDTGAPTTLTAHYQGYPGVPSTASFTARLLLVDQRTEVELGEVALFEDDEEAGRTRSKRRIYINELGAKLSRIAPDFVYHRDPDAELASDLRASRRYLALELVRDLGHEVFPTVAASKAQAFALALSRGLDAGAELGGYRVQPPVTPTVKRLRVGYSTWVIVSANEPAGLDRLLHVHPFGHAEIDPENPSFFPHYDVAGELYIGMRDVDAPRNLSLLLQTAEGTSDPERAVSPPTWSVLDGHRIRELGEQGRVLFDSTRGLLNTGIVELALPPVAPTARMPDGLYWVRLAVAEDTGGVCDLLDMRTQATTVRFDDRGNAPDHYEQPLPAGSIKRLLKRDARIAEVEQPSSSSGGRPSERAESLDTRVSERLRHKQRALCPWDYERLVLQRFPDIYKAKCLPAALVGRPGAVDVLVVPDTRSGAPADAFAPLVSADRLQDVQTYLAACAPAASAVTVRNPRYIPVQVRLGVRLRDGVDAAQAQQQLNRDLTRFLSPWAFAEGAELTIGGKIFETSVLNFVDRLDYVNFVTDVRLYRTRDVVASSAPDGFVQTESPDEALVSARHHFVDVMVAD